MLSIYPILTDEDDDGEMPQGWDFLGSGYHDDRQWVVTYQRSERASVQTLFTGDKLSAIRFYRGAIEAWG